MINDKDPITIAQDTQEILSVNDDCVFYYAGNDHHLCMYDFASKKSIDAGAKISETTFSKGKNSVAVINEDGEVSIFSRFKTENETLFNVGEDEISVVCVADDGSNLVWSKKDVDENYDDICQIYTMVNGAPEKIGKIEDSHVIGFYYNNSQSCLISSPEDAPPQLILYNENISNEIELPGMFISVSATNVDGDYIISEDMRTDDLYISVCKDEDSEQTTLYKMSSDGNLAPLVENIMLNIYKMHNNNIFYINTDGDLFYKKINDEGEEKNNHRRQQFLYLAKWRIYLHSEIRRIILLEYIGRRF